MLNAVGEMLQVGESKQGRKETFHDKRLHRKFMRDVTEVADERLWRCLGAGYLGKSTEGYVSAAQELAL